MLGDGEQARPQTPPDNTLWTDELLQELMALFAHMYACLLECKRHGPK